MKTQIVLGLIIVVLFGVYSFSIYKMGQDKERERNELAYQEYLRRYEFQDNFYKNIISYLEKEIDSLKNVKQQIITKWKYRESNISENLQKDSSVAIAEYRKGLSLLDTRPDTTELLSNREMGFGALYFNELSYKREEIINANETILKQDDLIDTYKEQTDTLRSKNILLGQKLALEQDKQPSWWYKRFGCFIGGGVGYDTNTKQVNPQVGIYFGFNLF